MILQNKPTNISPLEGLMWGYFSNSQIQDRISHFEPPISYISPSLPTTHPIAKKPSNDSHVSLMSISAGSTNLESTTRSVTPTLLQQQKTRSRNGSVSERDKSPTSFHNSSGSDSGHDNASETSSNSENHGFSSKSRYKTELCRSFQETGYCRYQNKCQYAHGEHELRQVARHQKYKSELCHNYHYEGTCMYGIRCCFIHQIQRNNMGRAASQNIELVKLKQPGRLHAFLELQQQHQEVQRSTPTVDPSIPLTFATAAIVPATPAAALVMDANSNQIATEIHPQEHYQVFQYQQDSHHFYNSYSSIYFEKEEQIEPSQEQYVLFDKKLKSKREPNL